MIEVVASTASTNADLARRIAAGEDVSEGHWLRALEQTAGRGRRGRQWFSAGGNLYCSTVVRSRAGDPALHTLAFVAALAVRDAVATFVSSDTNLLLKWPNDLLVDGAKLSGILLERTADAVIAGIGVNVASAPELPDRATAALDELSGAAVDAGEVLVALETAFSARLAQWRAEGAAGILAKWTALAHPEGTAMAIAVDGEGVVEGQFAGLDGGGGLRLRLPTGSLRVIHAGDVSLV